jgi:hypothetical protein
MNPLIVVNFHRQSELAGVAVFAARFGESFRGVSDLKTPLTSWPVLSMQKMDAEWTKRFLRLFLAEKNFDCLIKIDPDTSINGELPLPVLGGDVAGDFRKSKFGWIWFGGYHFYTRAAAEKILADTLFDGRIVSQDIPQTKSVIRLGLKAEQLAGVNCWKMPEDADAIVSHFGHSRIPASPPGLITLAA